MPDLLLYTLVVPRASQTDLANRLQQQLAKAGVIGEDVAVAEQVSNDPANQTVSGVYRGRYADKMAAELEELSTASGFDTIPIDGVDGETSLAGYYAVERADVKEPSASTDLAQQYELSLAKRGRQASHYRAIETNPYQVDHDSTWGNDIEALVGIPSTASKVQWYDRDSGRVPATSIETRSAELGDVEIYDLEDAPGYAFDPSSEEEGPTLLYQIDYTDEELVDCRIYDTLGEVSKHDADGDLQWRKVFSTEHDVGSELVLDNGLLRLRLDEGAGTIAAEEWDAGLEEWTDVTLSQPSTVDLFDVDVCEASMVQDCVQLTFDVDGSLFALNAMLSRGANAILFAIPDNESGPIPQDLLDWLAPIASSTIVDAQPSKTLVSRSDVRR